MIVLFFPAAFQEQIHFKNVTISADTDIFLECFFENPTYLDWQKDGKAIEVSNAYQERRVYIIRGEGLLVLNAQYSDRGYYTCLGIRQQYLIQKTILLDVAPSSDSDRPLRSCESWFVQVISIVFFSLVDLDE